MRHWDTSALLPLLLEEAQTAVVRQLLELDGDLSVWCITEVEIASALARRTRESYEPVAIDRAWAQLRWLAERWRELTAIEPARSRALRLLNTHPLRAADALQLAAALVACDERPDTLPFVSLDDRLRDAARREGFPVLPA